MLLNAIGYAVLFLFFMTAVYMTAVIVGDVIGATVRFVTELLEVKESAKGGGKHAKNKR